MRLADKRHNPSLYRHPYIRTIYTYMCACIKLYKAIYRHVCTGVYTNSLAFGIRDVCVCRLRLTRETFFRLRHDSQARWNKGKESDDRMQRKKRFPLCPLQLSSSSSLGTRILADLSCLICFPASSLFAYFLGFLSWGRQGGDNSFSTKRNGFLPRPAQ